MIPFYYWKLNSDAARDGSAVDAFTNTRANSTVFSYAASPNTDGEDQVAYCWAAVEGYSAFGHYDGNGGSNGPFLYTGFRPKFVMIKNATASAKWVIQDTTRSTYNNEVASLYPDTDIVEYNGIAHRVDYLSNGFKVRSTDAIFNGNTQTYIYAAFAEHPFKTARAR